jgi:hypothetical protein
MKDDLLLAKKLDELRSQFGADSEFPDVIAVWEAIKRITGRNQRCVEQGIAPYPLPEWVNEYLLRSADKIGRLELGIRVEDDRPLSSMNFNEVGELRKVPEGKGGRCRDARSDHVAAALGLVRKGWNAFQHHDKSIRNAQYLELYDNPALKDDKHLRREVQGIVIGQMKKNEHMEEPAAHNRLSKARRKT